MKHAYVFPGQGAQFSGMGKDLYENNESAKALFEKADEILGFRITDIMFGGTADELKQTKVTQPAVFLHSVILAKVLGVKPDAVAGHSLGARLKEAGARRALRLPVGGAFHSPLMEDARAELEQAIAEVEFHTPVCPIYQNVDAQPQTDPEKIKANLIAQLTAPVRWTQIVRNMLADGVSEFTELGPGNVLQGLIKKVNAEAAVESKASM